MVKFQSRRSFLGRFNFSIHKARDSLRIRDELLHIGSESFEIQLKPQQSRWAGLRDAQRNCAGHMTYK